MDDHHSDEHDDHNNIIDLPPPLWSTPTHYRTTRKGKIHKSVSERYLRDDLGSGYVISSGHTTRKTGGVAVQTAGPARRVDGAQELLGMLSSSSSNNSNKKNKEKRRRPRLVITDANVLLHNLDVLEHPSYGATSSNIILVIPQTALVECRHRSLTAYGRVVELLRSSGGGGGGSGDSKQKQQRNNNNRRAVIFFPDVHHVETQPAARRQSNNQANSTTINDTNDERIRLVAELYGTALSGTDVEVVLLTDDADCRRRAESELRAAAAAEAAGAAEDDDGDDNDDRNGNVRHGHDKSDWLYQPKSVRQHVRDLEREDPTLGLSDVVAQFTSAPTAGGTTGSSTATAASSGQGQTPPAYHYAPHLSQSSLTLGIKSGKYYQGHVRSERTASYGTRCYVTVRRGDERIAVTLNGRADVNRAVDGDVVAVELHGVERWIGGGEEEDGATTTKGTKEGGNGGDEDGDGAGIAPETAEPSLKDQDNVVDEVVVPTTATTTASSASASTSEEVSVVRRCRPTGRVVGIVRRNFRQNYCGSIYSAASTSATAASPSASASASAAAPDASSSASSPTDADDNAGAGSTSNNDASAEDAPSPSPPRKRTERESISSEHEVEHPDGTTTCVFFAVDTRIPPILLRTTQRDRLLGKRILVAIDSWPSNSQYPLGHYVRTIGDAGGKDVETEVLLHEHDIPCDPFPATVLACLPSENYKIDMESSPGRLDLRHLPVLSIDPPGCKDIDDALHCTVLPNGNYQAGVHIADVTHYVEAGTAIDTEAANRSTSTYLVNKRLDMLPGLLTTDLCSLKGNVDRYAFSVLWEVTPEADIVNVEFHKTIIHSIAALTYQQAQGMIDQPDDEADVQAGAVKRLASLARKFRAKRIAAGALTLASPEVKFVLDSESLNPTDVQAYALFEANALVEEFMLLANVTVGKKILRHYPTLSILRRHPAPNRGMFDGLISKARCRGFSINIDDSKRLADSLDEAQIESDPYFNKLLRILSTRCMSPAQYFCSGEYKPTDWHHYGLAAPVYTHFTSPIRRYADVCVHRLLAAAIGVAPLPVHLSSKSYLHDLAANMNRRHRAAQLAGRASVQLHTLIFFSGEDGAKVEDAYVLDVDTAETAAEPSFTVIVPRYGIEGRVRLSHVSSDDRNLIRDADRHRISYRDGETGEVTASVQVFEKVRVRIWVRVVQENQKELVLDLVEPKFTGAVHPKQASGTSEHPSKRKLSGAKETSPSKKKRAGAGK